MGSIKDETGRAVGLPQDRWHFRSTRSAPPDLNAACIDVARTFIDLDLKGARVVMQGFGAVGKHAARFLAGNGAILVGASDTSGTLADPAGLDVAALIALKEQGKSLHDYSRGQKLDADAILDIACDIWIPAARPDVVHADNVARLNTKLMAQGANIPVRRRPNLRCTSAEFSRCLISSQMRAA